MEDSTPSVSTVEHGGMTIETVGVSEKDARASLSIEETPEPGKGKGAEKGKDGKLSPSDHARELGRRGGKAAAEKRAEAAEREEKPAERPKGKADQSVSADPNDPDESDDDEDAPLSKRAQRRVEVATRKQAEARRELERERSEREQERQRYEARLAALEVREGRPAGDGRHQQERPAQHDPEARPRAEDFENYSDYEDARDAWNRRQWTREHEGRQHAEREVHRVKAHVDDFLKHVTPDMLDSIDPELTEMRPVHFMQEGERLSGDNLIATELMYLRSEAPAVLKHLTKHPEGIAALRRLFNPSDPRGSHINIRVAVQRLAGHLGSRADATAGDPPASGERAPKPAISKAHPPVRPVAGAPHVADGDAMPRSGEEFDAWRQRRKRA